VERTAACLEALDVDVLLQKPFQSMTALMSAALYGKSDILRLLLARGANIDGSTTRDGVR